MYIYIYKYNYIHTYIYVFIYINIYIYTITKKIKIWKNFYALLIKKTFSNCQGSYHKEPFFTFQKSRNFFHRVNIEIFLSPSPLPVRFCSLFTEHTSLPPQWTLYLKKSEKRIDVKRKNKEEKEEVHDMLVHSYI